MANYQGIFLEPHLHHFNVWSVSYFLFILTVNLPCLAMCFFVFNTLMVGICSSQRAAILTLTMTTRTKKRILQNGESFSTLLAGQSLYRDSCMWQNCGELIMKMYCLATPTKTKILSLLVEWYRHYLISCNWLKVEILKCTPKQILAPLATTFRQLWATFFSITA